MAKKVLVALSGGVDSAAAAVQVLQSGMEPVGVYMCLQTNVPQGIGGKACCSPQDAADARRIASKLGFEMTVYDAMDQFDVIKDEFIRSYESGRTPNPCIRCNELIKFGSLFKLADQLGADYISTGHYARIVSKDNTPMIAKAKNTKKDQSYVLFNIQKEYVSRIIFPNGDIPDKSDVREIVKNAGLEIYDKPESQDICFVPDGNYRKLLEERNSKALTPGNIVDCDGNILGTHEGYGLYTIGQRRGLNIAAGIPVYVSEIDPQTATVTIGPKDSLISSGVKAYDANWFKDMPARFECDAQIRYGNTRIRSTVRLGDNDTFEVTFNEPAFAATPGQAVVLYDEDILLGGGWIDKNIRKQ